VTGKPALRIWQAAALGALHGPAELLPVSSSAHVMLVPRLLGWEYDRLPADTRKTFDVALHGGTALALLRITKLPDARTAVLTTLPAAIAGVTLEDAIESRLGGTTATAAGLIAGSIVLVAADAAARGRTERAPGRCTPREALLLGVAQALALMPGVSRLGMTVSAARLLGYSRESAFAVGRSAGLPVMLGACVLKGVRVAQTGIEPQLRGPFAAGTVAAAVSTLAAAPLVRRTPVTGAALWRGGLATWALRRRK